MYKKIMVAYDGSEGSDAALKHAADLASQQHSTLILTHIVKDKRTASSQSSYQVPYGGLAGAPMGAETREKAPQEERLHEQDRGQAILRQAKNKLDLASSQVETEILYGDNPAKKVCEYADINDVDIIIMGNRGLHGVRKFMLGSISQKVAENAHCPVLIVKQK